MPIVARVTAVAGAMLIALALTGCTFPIDPVMPDAAGPTTSAPTPTSEAAPQPAACQDEFSAELLWNPESEVPVTATIRLTNEGAEPCDLTGFPGGVEFLADGQPLTISYDQTEQADGFDRAGTTVTVHPGGSAYVWIWVRRGEPVVGAPDVRIPRDRHRAVAHAAGRNRPGDRPRRDRGLHRRAGAEVRPRRLRTAGGCARLLSAGFIVESP